jgi:predicted PurR-regulated permease PerM
MADGKGVDPGRTWLVKWGVASWAFLGIVGAVAVIGIVLSRANQVFIPLVVAVILGVLLEPFVNFLKGHHFPRWLASLLVLLLLLSIVAGFLTVVIYGVSTQAHRISSQVDAGVKRIQNWFSNLKMSKSFINWVRQAVEKAWPNIGEGLARRVSRSVSGVASFAIGAFIGLFILFFILNDDGRIKGWASRNMGVPEEQGKEILEDVAGAIRGYFRGTTAIAFVNAVIIIPVLLILRVPLVGAISLVTFVTCYIPSFGGYIGGAFAVFIALASRGLTAGLIVLVFAIVAHTILQTPVQAWAYGKTLQMHPLLALLVTLLGLIFGGVAGAILAVPLTATVIRVRASLKSVRESGENEEFGFKPGAV